MRIWLIGADHAGTEALRQLKKNPGIDVVVSDMIEKPKAVTDRLIPRVDHVEHVTPFNFNQLARRVRPDLVLIDASAAQRAMGRVSGGIFLTEGLHTEMATISEFPCIVLQ
jgi:hypothetical protein